MKVYIRPFHLNDAMSVLEAIKESQQELSRWMVGMQKFRTLEDVQNWIAENDEAQTMGSSYNFAMVDSQDNGFLGGCGIIQIDHFHRTGTLYGWVRTNSTGMGVATSAGIELIRFGIERLQLKRLELLVAIDNHASERLVKKLGAVYEGTLRNRLNINGEWSDAFMFSLIPSDI